MARDLTIKNITLETDAIQIAGVCISVGEGLQILHRRGYLRSMLQKAAEDRVISTHAQILGFAPTDAQLQQAADRFRRRSGLLSSQQTKAWLVARNLSEVDFEELILLRLRYEFVFSCVTETAAHSFQSTPAFWDRWTYRELFVPSESLAEELKCQHIEEAIAFADLADRHNASDPVGQKPAQSCFCSMLPQWLRAFSNDVRSGSLIGPLACPSGWALILVEEVTPAVFDQETEAAIRKDLFQQWISARMREANITYPLLDLLSCQNDS